MLAWIDASSSIPSTFTGWQSSEKKTSLSSPHFLSISMDLQVVIIILIFIIDIISIIICCIERYYIWWCYYITYIYYSFCCSMSSGFSSWNPFKPALMSFFYDPMVSEHFLIFWHDKIVQAHLIFSLFQAKMTYFFNKSWIL